MTKIITNSKYAPGIATYGADGKQGKTGEAGYALYFIPYNINNLDNPSDDNNEYRQLVNSILNNKFITNNSNLDIELLVMKNRSYQINDLFLFPSGEIYKLIDINAISQSVTFERAGELLKQNQLFNIVNNVILNSNNMPLLLGYNIENVDDINSLLTIGYDKDNDKSLISFIDVNNGNRLDFKSTSDNGLLFESHNPSYFDNVYIKYDDDAPLSYGAYFKAVNDVEIKISDSEEPFYTHVNGILSIEKTLLTNNCEIVYFVNVMDGDNTYIERKVELVMPSTDTDDVDYAFVTDDKLSVELCVYGNGYVAKFIKIK